MKKYFVFKNQKALEASMFGVLIQPNSNYCGIPLSDIQLPNQCVFLGVLREIQVISAIDNPSIFARNYILTIATHPLMVTLSKLLLKNPFCLLFSEQLLIGSSTNKQ